jgi:hypothetical protein
LLRRLLVVDTIELEDKRIATFATPIEYAEGNEDIVDVEDEEGSLSIVPIFVGGKALNFTAFSVRAGDVTNGYYLFGCYHCME